MARNKNMGDWTIQLNHLEQEGSFDIAIFLLEKIIKENPDSMDAYLALLYLLMDTVVEGACYWSNVSKDPLRALKEEYYRSKEKEYCALGARYFKESYEKFSDNPHYLYIVSYIFVMEPWSFGVDDSLCEYMWKRIYELDPHNPLYQADYYGSMYKKDPRNPELLAWAELMIGPSSPLNIFDGKGRAWEYAQCMAKSFPKKVLQNEPN